MIPFEFAYGLGAGLGVAAGLYLVLWWRARRHAIGSLPPAGALRNSPGHTHPPERVASPAPDLLTGPLARLASEQDESASPTVSLEPAPRLPDDPTVGSNPTVTRVPRRTLPPTETLRLSQRVILHVYGQGHLPPGEVAPPGLCQAGIGEALGIPQAGLAAVLRRLEAAGVLTTERGHVRGHDRRLKIYRLSGRGVEVAKELRGRHTPASGR